MGKAKAWVPDTDPEIQRIKAWIAEQAGENGPPESEEELYRRGAERARLFSAATQRKGMPVTYGGQKREKAA